MIHRTRRMPPALPARRGMLAPWFRGRDAVDGARPAPPASPEAVLAPSTPGVVDSGEPDAARERTAVRPAMGPDERRRADRTCAARPTYGQRVF